MNDKNIMTDYKCLMITTIDQRKFFTYERNYPQLVEFSKLFGAEISVVNVKEAEVLDLAQLAPAFCDANYIAKQITDYQVLEIKLPKKQKQKREDILKKAQVIQNYIMQTFLNKEVVSLKKLTKKFHEDKLTLACLCNHISIAKKHLEGQGRQISKIGGGKYAIND